MANGTANEDENGDVYSQGFSLAPQQVQISSLVVVHIMLMEKVLIKPKIRATNKRNERRVREKAKTTCLVLVCLVNF